MITRPLGAPQGTLGQGNPQPQLFALAQRCAYGQIRASQGQDAEQLRGIIEVADAGPQPVLLVDPHHQAGMVALVLAARRHPQLGGEAAGNPGAEEVATVALAAVVGVVPEVTVAIGDDPQPLGLGQPGFRLVDPVADVEHGALLACSRLESRLPRKFV